MKLQFAEKCAAKLVEWIHPHCERVEVAGSIRRLKPEVMDVDLVVIPKMEEEKDLYGKVIRSRNLTWVEIDARATRDKWTVLRAGAEVVTVVNAGVQVDFFFATRESWGTVLLCRTGSKEHNIWLAKLAEQRGGRWHPQSGLHINRQVFGATEEGIYAALGFANPIPPAEREANRLPMAGMIRTPAQGGSITGGAR